MKKLDIIPTAHEWHNPETGHCYVDYIERKDYEDAGDYTKTPLYKLNDVKLLWAVYDGDDESIISVHQTFGGANENRLLLERQGITNTNIDLCVVHL